MIIPDVKLPIVRKVIHSLYAEDFSEAVVHNVASSVTEAVDSHYFALLLIPNRYAPKHLLVSNNPPDFLSVYVPLISDDFLIRHLVNTSRFTWLKEISNWGMQNFKMFCHEVQKVHPVSDIILEPIKRLPCRLLGPGKGRFKRPVLFRQRSGSL